MYCKNIGYYVKFTRRLDFVCFIISYLIYLIIYFINVYKCVNIVFGIRNLMVSKIDFSLRFMECIVFLRSKLF